MAKYKNILVAYINENKSGDGQKYLNIKNVSGGQVILNDGESVYLRMTPDHIKEKYPNIPDFTKSYKEEEEKSGAEGDPF